MKKLKVLALSDLHLGEPEGLLNDSDGAPNIREIVVRKISEISKGGDGLEDGIEELILIGDIADLSEATEKEAFDNTKDFLTALLRNVSIGKVVYIPGNHDHRLWVEMLKAHYGKGSYEDCAPKTRVAVKRPKILMENCMPSDYRGEVEAHYPCYTVKTDNSYFFFDHGHLFSNLLKKMAGPVASLEEIEEKTHKFMEMLWYKGNKPLKIWFNNVREKVYDWGRWISDRARHPSRGTSFKEDSTPVYDDGMRDNIIRYVENLLQIDLSSMNDFHFVFGHTHYGGRVLRDDRKVRANGRFITLWNTGGWLVPSEVFSPDAYIFYIEQTGDGPEPKAYKFVARAENQEGDYDRPILDKIVKGVGKT